VYSPVEGGNLQPPDSFHVSAMDKLVESVHGFRAESEIDAIRQRHEVGMIGRCRAGLHPTNASIPYGYRAVPGHRQVVTVDEAEAGWVRWIFERRAEQWGTQAIIRELMRLKVPAPRGGQRWGFGTIVRMVRNPFYVGTVRYGKIANPNGLHEHIISDDLWRRVQSVNESRSAWAADRGAGFALAGLMRCGHCGWSMYYNAPHGGRGYSVVNCGRYKRYGREWCVNNAHRAEPVVERVYSLVQSIGRNPALYWEQNRNGHLVTLTDELTMIEAQITDMATRYDRLLDLVERGVLDPAKFSERALKLDAVPLKARRDELAARVGMAEAAEARIGNVVAVADEMDAMDAAALRAVYANIIARITFWRDRDPEIALY
jgi:hypothetical protein